MANEVSFNTVAPIIPVLDLDSSLERYALLGFAVERSAGGERYGFVNRDEVFLHLSEWSAHDPKRTAASVYLYVSDADALYAQWAELSVAGRLIAPQDTTYGLREFAYIDPEGTLHRIGSPIAVTSVA
ncbi:MAG: VOC family protein [Actinomycetota bacterium]|nr:VOC family protein [Actinomycetota bacterium]